MPPRFQNLLHDLIAGQIAILSLTLVVRSETAFAPAADETAAGASCRQVLCLQ